MFWIFSSTFLVLAEIFLSSTLQIFLSPKKPQFWLIFNFSKKCPALDWNKDEKTVKGNKISLGFRWKQVPWLIVKLMVGRQIAVLMKCCFPPPGSCIHGPAREWQGWEKHHQHGCSSQLALAPANRKNSFPPPPRQWKLALDQNCVVSIWGLKRLLASDLH